MSRHLYLAALPQFLKDTSDERLVGLLANKLVEIGQPEPTKGERTSWRNSLSALASVLRAPEFHESQVFVELFMPLNNQRCDVLLTGRNATGASAVVVELKQWTFVYPSHLPDHVLEGGMRSRIHPSIQVRDYVETLRHYHSAFTGKGEQIHLAGAVFLHNMELAQAGYLRDPLFGGIHLDYPIFLGGEGAALARWLSARLIPGPGLPVAERIKAGRPLPSPKLLDLVVETVKNTHQWRLLDQQKTVFFQIRHAVISAREMGEKKVIIVRGGPGTGKSVVAIQLLAEAARQNWAVAHATGTKAFQTVLQAITAAFADEKVKAIHHVKTKKALPVKHLFTTFSDIASTGAKRPNVLDLTVCDEAHRLWEYRQSKYGTKVKILSDRPMVQEVIAASRVTVFFLDDNQSVRSGEIGHSDLIVDHAKAMGVPVQRFELDAQFRCAGSESYIHWVDGVFQFRARLDVAWRDHDVYKVRIWNEMPKMDAHLRALREEGQRCRLVAGFCWRWNKPDGLGKLPPDVADARFGAWRGPWIIKSDKDAAPLEHRYYWWANQEFDKKSRRQSYDQVGSIYSVQGFEFDSVGVIWGEDLVWRNGAWVADLQKNKDHAFKNDLRKSGESAVAKLINVYRVLLTRGMRETHLFVLDPETRAHLQSCLEHKQALKLAVGAAPDTHAHPKANIGRKLAAVSSAAAPRFSPRPTVPGKVDPWRSGVPVLDLAAAAGGFGEEKMDPGDLLRSEEWITWQDAPSFSPGMFVARVVGRSMQPLVNDGAWCLFRLASVEEMASRPMLVQLAGKAEGASRFTLKDVQAEWSANREGGRECVALVLTPRNSAYPTLRLEGESLSGEVRVVAELVQVLD